MATKKWSYHTTHSFTLGKKKITMASQLYQVGVYVILNNDPGRQMNMAPADMVKTEKMLNADKAAGKIKALKFGTLIEVIEDADGLYKKV
jgi:hypothetical protein